MFAPIAVFLVVYFIIATELIDKTIAALVGAAIMMISALEHHGVFEKMGEFILHICGGNLMATVLTILWFRAIASAIVDNIPLVMAMIPLVKGIVPIFAMSMGLADPALIQIQIAEPLLWALALGACLGGNGTLVGASANVVIAQIANRNNCKISFMSFTKYGFPFMLASLICTYTFATLCSRICIDELYEKGAGRKPAPFWFPAFSVSLFELAEGIAASLGLIHTRKSYFLHGLINFTGTRSL